MTDLTTCPFHNPDNTDDSGLDYNTYLQLHKILGANKCQSNSHTEHLFITIHQSFELWFKQMIHEVRAVKAQFKEQILEDDNLLFIHHCLGRISAILNTLAPQFRVLESMGQIEFLEFRSFLGTASGFQSYQFRVLENLLGLRPEWRNRYAKKDYKAFLSPVHAKLVKEAEEEDSLLDCLDKWLSRCPYLYLGDWDFWEEYSTKVKEYLVLEHRDIDNDDELDAKEKQIRKERISLSWEPVLNEEFFNAQRKKGRIRWSYEAFQGALFIKVYRNMPSLQMPFQLLRDVMDIETAMNTFRMRHAEMVHRMIGAKVGTGGSSGYDYLRTSGKKHQIFSDLFDISTHLVPNFDVQLPRAVNRRLRTPSVRYLNQTSLLPQVTVDKSLEGEPAQGFAPGLFSLNFLKSMQGNDI